jgi:hypothetical protein
MGSSQSASPVPDSENRFSAKGTSMPTPLHPSSPPETITPAGDEVSDAALERVMREVPRGALALSGLTVGLLLLAWFLMYAFVFLPRGSVG